MAFDAVEALVQAERDMERGFTNEAIAYALISLAHSALGEEEREDLPDARVALQEAREATGNKYTHRTLRTRKGHCHT